MSYSYSNLKPEVFKEENQALFLSIRDKVKSAIKQHGAVRLQEILHGNSGSTWIMLACIDRLVELGEIKELAIDAPVANMRIFTEA